MDISDQLEATIAPTALEHEAGLRMPHNGRILNEHYQFSSLRFDRIMIFRRNENGSRRSRRYQGNAG
jgi:hypothetical protein